MGDHTGIDIHTAALGVPHAAAGGHTLQEQQPMERNSYKSRFSGRTSGL